MSVAEEAGRGHRQGGRPRKQTGAKEKWGRERWGNRERDRARWSRAANTDRGHRGERSNRGTKDHGKEEGSVRVTEREREREEGKRRKRRGGERKGRGGDGRGGERQSGTNLQTRQASPWMQVGLCFQISALLLSTDTMDRVPNIPCPSFLLRES